MLDCAMASHRRARSAYGARGGRPSSARGAVDRQRALELEEAQQVLVVNDETGKQVTRCTPSTNSQRRVWRLT